MTTITTRDEWLHALDALTAESSVSDVVSLGCADGVIAGIDLMFDDPEWDDERAVIVGEGPDGTRWVVAWDPQRGEWI